LNVGLDVVGVGRGIIFYVDVGLFHTLAGDYSKLISINVRNCT